MEVKEEEENEKEANSDGGQREIVFQKYMKNFDFFFLFKKAFFLNKYVNCFSKILKVFFKISKHPFYTLKML